MCGNRGIFALSLVTENVFSFKKKNFDTAESVPLHKPFCVQAGEVVGDRKTLIMLSTISRKDGTRESLPGQIQKTLPLNILDW